MEGKIISYLNACMNHDDLPLTSAVRCAKALKASRVDVTACMNKLVQSNDLVRILSRPYLYVPVSWLSEHYIYTDQSEFASVSEFMQLFEKQTTNTQDPFDQLVGNHHSLKPMISQLKAAISYPPEGLPILLKGPTGTGKSKWPL